MSGFGNWTPQQEGGDLESGGGAETSSFFGGVPALPEGMPDMSWSSFKSSLESQMPQRVMGMNYQERFKVRILHRCSFCLRPGPENVSSNSSQILNALALLLLVRTFSLPFNSPADVLRPINTVSAVLCACLCRGFANDIHPTTEVCLILYLWQSNIHGIIRYPQGTVRAFDGHAGT